MVSSLFSDIKKFNPYHGSDGRFTSAGSATSFTWRTKDTSKQSLADSAKSTERSRVRTNEIHSVEDRIRNQDFESASVIDSNGNQILFKDGEKSQVAFTSEEISRMKGSTLTHNHPSGAGFSREDIGMLVGASLKEMRATTRDGKTFSIARADGYEDSNGIAFYNEFGRRYEDAYRRACVALDNRGYMEKVSSGAVSQEQANRECTLLTTDFMVQWFESEAKYFNLNFKIEERKSA